MNINWYIFQISLITLRILERSLLPSDHNNSAPIESVPGDLCAFCLFNDHLNLTGTAPGSGASVCLTSLTSCVFSKWRSEPCGIRSVLQSVSCSPFSSLFHGDSTLSSPPTKHFCANRWPVILAPTLCFKLIHFIFLYSPIFPSEILQLLCATFGSHRAFFDHELLRFIQRLLLMKYGVREIHLLCLLYEKFFTPFVCSNISLKIQRLHGTYWSLWYLLIFMRQFCTT